MHIRFQRTELVNANPDRLWHILTDYESYPRTNPLVTHVRVLRRDVHGAEVEADRKVFFEPHAHFFDTYAPPPLRQLERGYANDTGMRSVWTVEPANGDRAYFTIADADLPPVVGWLMRPFLARMFLPSELSDIHPGGGGCAGKASCRAADSGGWRLSTVTQ